MPENQGGDFLLNHGRHNNSRLLLKNNAMLENSSGRFRSQLRSYYECSGSDGIELEMEDIGFGVSNTCKMMGGGRV